MSILKWSLLIAALPVAALLLAYLWGRTLPMEHVAEGRRDIAAPAATVAGWIRDVESHPGWREVERIEVLEREANGVRYREHGAHGAITFRLRETKPDRVFESVIVDTDLAFGGRWLLRVEPSGSHSVVTIREEGVVRPALFRFLSRYAFGHATTLNQYLAALAARAERTPARAPG
jgi:hypothetical protein